MSLYPAAGGGDECTSAFPAGDGPANRRSTVPSIRELYESKGDQIRTSEHCARFIELWEKAEPELQSAVREAPAAHRTQVGDG